MNAMNATNKIGVLLINLGTPESTEVSAVRRYLNEFLSDPRVIDLPYLLRWLLVKLLILPFRPRKSAHAYQQIWQDSGSPLLIYSRAVQRDVQQQLGEHYQVELAMRYGKPNLMQLNALQHCQKIIILPLFPQYASVTTGSIFERCFRIMQKWKNIPALNFINQFYRNADFIHAWAAVIKNTLKNHEIDVLLFSFHGIPIRQLTQKNCHSCAQTNFCNTADSDCYRAQCFATANAIAKQLELEQNQFLICFQSRLGKLPWIQPYTEQMLPELIKKGQKRIAIACPSFVTDCLETLEEINIRARKQWLDLGGEEFIFVPCINNHTIWINGLTNLIKFNAQE